MGQVGQEGPGVLDSVYPCSHLGFSFAMEGKPGGGSEPRNLFLRPARDHPGCCLKRDWGRDTGKGDLWEANEEVTALS